MESDEESRYMTHDVTHDEWCLSEDKNHTELEHFMFVFERKLRMLEIRDKNIYDVIVRHLKMYNNK